VQHTKDLRKGAEDLHKLAIRWDKGAPAELVMNIHKKAATSDARAEDAFSPILEAHKKSGCMFANPLPDEQTDGDVRPEQETSRTDVGAPIASANPLEADTTITSREEQTLEPYSEMAREAWHKAEWDNCIQAKNTRSQDLIIMQSSEIMQVRINASHRWLKQHRGQAADSLIGTAEKEIKGDYAAAIVDYKAAIHHDECAASVVGRLMVAHRDTDYEFAKIIMTLGEIAVKPAVQDYSELTDTEEEMSYWEDYVIDIYKHSLHM